MAAPKKTTMKKGKTQEMDDAPCSKVFAEERVNEHKSYMKIQVGEDSGKQTINSEPFPTALFIVSLPP